MILYETQREILMTVSENRLVSAMEDLSIGHFRGFVRVYYR